MNGIKVACLSLFVALTALVLALTGLIHSMEMSIKSISSPRKSYVILRVIKEKNVGPLDIMTGWLKPISRVFGRR